MKQLLFLCTGNYYRSRYAEILFNDQAVKTGLPWRAFSRGLAPDPLNPGPLSRHTAAALTRLEINFDEHLRMPILVTAADFEQADHVVAVKEAEHRRMIEQGFADWLPKVEFWHVHDLDCCGPEEALPHLDREVAALVKRLRLAAGD
jgi:protein-tyrosine phosphatase